MQDINKILVFKMIKLTMCQETTTFPPGKKHILNRKENALVNIFYRNVRTTVTCRGSVLKEQTTHGIL